MGFSRQEYWSSLPFPSPGDRPNPGIELMSPALASRFFIAEPQETPCFFLHITKKLSELVQLLSLGLIGPPPRAELYSRKEVTQIWTKFELRGDLLDCSTTDRAQLMFGEWVVAPAWLHGTSPRMEPSDMAPFQGLAVSSHREEDLKLQALL